MRDAEPKAIHLKDYRVPAFLVERVDLEFVLGEDETRVRSRLRMRRNPSAGVDRTPLVLDGQELELLQIAIDGRVLSSAEFATDAAHLTVFEVPGEFDLSCETRIHPERNTALEGLYTSRGMFCTQCEAEGFRRITYYPDRPDVMAVFTTRIEADVHRYPVLLSNGNLVEWGALGADRHYAVWEDPFPKPCYLFALVAGNLAHVEDSFTTASGRQVALRIYVEPKDLAKCGHAMDSLKRAMRWDEEVYGREYDLDIYMIVAVDDFNMGAMENKGLNVFNTSCILASPETTTDTAFQRVEAVVAHEYFHNWSGNRVTCRDRFQLSLKEGFTVFRDAEFSADMGSRTVKRIEDVALLRTQQFAEDAGPMSHPVRPASFIEISNFYTLTVYEKGAEVVRMLHTLLGAETFRRGCDLYFERHDGQAVTCDDFVAAMETASGRDLEQFKRWYAQGGTPRLDISGHYDAEARSYRLSVTQSCPPTPGQPHKLPYHMPLAVGLVGAAGDLPLRLRGEPTGVSATTRVLELRTASEEFEFVDIDEAPVPSLLRGFSAPVKLQFPYSRDDLMFLMSRDSDGFNQWDACQQLGVSVLQDCIAQHLAGAPLAVDDRLLDAFEHLLGRPELDRAMLAHMLVLPSEAYLAEISPVIHVEAIHAARNAVRAELARRLEPRLWTLFDACRVKGAYRADAEQIALRALRNVALGYLMQSGGQRALDAASAQFAQAENMTDLAAALSAVVNSPMPEARPLADKLLDQFYQRWQHEALVVNQWFGIQAACPLPGGLERVEALVAHPAFDPGNPNKLRALIGTFSQQNAINFHRADGRGCTFLAEQVLQTDRRNPQIAARLCSPLTRWRRYEEAAAMRMKQALEAMAATDSLSRDLFEVVRKSLA